MKIDIEKCVLNEYSSFKAAMQKIELNSLGFLVITDDAKKCVGVLSDGDVRRAFMDGVSIESQIFNYVNRNFVYASTTTPRENLIKMLDSQIHFIPILDTTDALVDIVTKDHLPLQAENSFIVRSRAPVRVSFGGGGSDVTHYFSNKQAAVINSTISLYSHATLRIRSDEKVIVSSSDLNAKFEANNLSEALVEAGPFRLIQAIFQAVKPTFGFELHVDSDFPIGSGLGGSATVSTAILGCFNEVRKDKWSPHEIAEIAYQAERIHLGISGGWQDQYAAVFGGFNFIEFNKKENVVLPLKLNSETMLELEESLVLCDTSIAHDSDLIHKNQKRAMSSEKVQELVKQNVSIAYSIRDNLLKGNLLEFGNWLNSSWMLKRKFSDIISDSYLDSIYDGALKNGAVGGKLLGAGGGGFFIFYAPPFQKQKLISYLKLKNLKTIPFCFEQNGLTSWTTRSPEC